MRLSHYWYLFSRADLASRARAPTLLYERESTSLFPIAREVQAGRPVASIALESRFLARKTNMPVKTAPKFVDYDVRENATTTMSMST